MKIYVSGSMAYDRIMDFPGKFSDYILPEKIHVLNVCFNAAVRLARFDNSGSSFTSKDFICLIRRSYLSSSVLMFLGITSSSTDQLLLFDFFLLFVFFFCVLEAVKI